MDDVRVRRLGMITVGLLIGCVLLTAACSTGQASPEDEAAKALMRRAMLTLEDFYHATGGYDVDWHYLSDVQSGLVFTQARRHVAGAGIDPSAVAAGLAANGAVTYFGDVHSYSIVTVSESGTIFGVRVDKTSGDDRYFCTVRDGVLSEGW